MKPSLRYPSSIVLLLVTGGVINADVYEDAIHSVTVNNHELNKIRSENLSEYYGLKSENALPGLEVEFENMWARGEDEYRWGLSVSQSFDFPGAYSARRREISARREAMELGYRMSKTDCVLQAYELLIEISYCNRSIELERSIVEDMESLSLLLKKSFEHGETTILDVNRSKIEQANSIIKLREHESQRAQCVAKLKALGYDLKDVEAVAYPLMEFSSRDVYIKAIDDNPVVAYYEAVKRAERLGVKARKAENMPGFTVGYVHEYEERTSFNGFKVGVTLPFYGAKSRVSKSRAMVEATDWAERLARVECESAIEAEYVNASVNKELYDILAPVFYNNNNIQLLRKAFEGGQMSAIDYLREIEYFRESEVDFLTIEYNYQLSLVRLNKFQLLLEPIDQ